MNILKKRVIFSLIMSLISTSLYSDYRPTHLPTLSPSQLKNPDLIKLKNETNIRDIKDFGWLKQVSLESKSYIISTHGFGEVSKFFIKSGGDGFILSQYKELEEYFTLRLRNFVSELKSTNLKNGLPKGSKIFFDLNIELNKYNDKLEIYYGLIDLKALFASKNQNCPKDWRIIVPIAGSDTQIKKFIKNELDSMAEKFASDYYMIDIKK